MTVKYFEVESGKSAEVLINQFSNEHNVFATQFVPIIQNGTTIGLGVFIYYSEDGVMVAQKSHELQASRFDSSSSDLSNYDKAKLDKITRQESGATKEVKMASQSQLKSLDKVGYQWAIKRENMTSKQAWNILQGFWGKGRK